ncbi:MAG: polysaccharide biosynthesis tyrosine autokinase [Candidatus Omnitrophota bacterium]|nr:MAG: polysaccharide biosynthesis tyrosine autokinase [Candidatus Omnitrophota bacterium]
MIPSPEIKELSFKDYFNIVWKRIWIVITILIIVPGFVAFSDFTTPKIYEVSAKVLIRREIPRVTGREEIVYRGGVPSREDQLHLLGSRTLAERVIKKLKLATDEEFIGVADPEGKVLSMVSVQTVRKSRAVTVFVRGEDPLKITNIANIWTREFINADVEERLKVVKYGIAWLSEQLDETLEKLEISEKKLNAFIKRERIVAMPDVGEQKETLIESMKAEKAKLEKELIEASKKYGGKHPTIISLESRLEAVTRKLKEEKDDLFALQEKALEYNILKREVDNYKSIYDSLFKRMKELEISQEMVVTNIQIVDEAVLPTVPIKPKPAKDILTAIAISLMIGIGFCIFLEYLDSTLKTSEDVEFYTKMPFLGYIPSGRHEIKREKDMRLISYLKPHSRVAEAFRNLRVSLIFSFPQDKSLKTVMVTSSIAKEGKSFISSNLAVIFAQTDEKTLLIDADMRKGSLHEGFGLTRKNGLSSVLAGVSSFEDAVVATSVPNLYFLSTGPHPPNPAELLSSERLNAVFEEAKKQFKRIVVDAPPILGVADPIILGGRCDGVAMLIRAGYTSLKLVSEAKKGIENKVKIIGAILNNVEIERDRYYYYHYYYSSEK